MAGTSQSLLAGPSGRWGNLNTRYGFGTLGVIHEGDYELGRHVNPARNDVLCSFLGFV